jgi:AraC-like DNA-binding protein
MNTTPSFPLPYISAEMAERKPLRSINRDFEIRPLDPFKEKNPSSENEMERLGTYEILWVKTGSGILTVNLQDHKIGDQVVYLLCPGQLRRIVYDDSGLDGYYISLSAEFFYGAGIDSKFCFLSSSYRNSNSPMVIKMDEEIQGEMEEILVKMRKEFTRYLTMRSEILKSLFKIFLLYLSRKVVVTSYSEIQTRDANLVGKFILLVGKYFTTKKMAGDYASELCVTGSYLNKAVKNVTGFTASHYIQQYVVLEAKRQASRSNRTMKEIAYDLGFDDTAHFSKFFKNACGMNFRTFKKAIFNIQEY